REDPGFLAGVKRVIDALLDAGEQRLSRTVEPQEMPVLGEELGDGDLPLASPHLGGGDRRLRLQSRRAGLRRVQLRAALCQGRFRRLSHLGLIHSPNARTLPPTWSASAEQAAGRPACALLSWNEINPLRRRAIARFRGSRNSAFHRQRPETERNPNDLPDATHEREGHPG